MDRDYGYMLIADNQCGSVVFKNNRCTSISGDMHWAKGKTYDDVMWKAWINGWKVIPI